MEEGALAGLKVFIVAEEIWEITPTPTYNPANSPCVDGPSQGSQEYIQIIEASEKGLSGSSSELSWHLAMSPCLFFPSFLTLASSFIPIPDFPKSDPFNLLNA